EKNYAEALEILTEFEAKFPDDKQYFVQTKIDIYQSQGKKDEAEKVYRAAFNPLWSDDEISAFISFLDKNDRLKIYETEIKQKFKKNPADFEAAIRLIHLEKDDNEEVEKICKKLQNARLQKKTKWSATELLIVSHFLINSGNGDSASRFLYTLCTDFTLEKQSDLRRKVLYQIFELLSDAGSERLALTKGDLKFFETIAKSDANPGITTGLLSLIFSDTNPRREFESKEKTAVKLFNRAAAYRIFNQFKAEYADAPELAQMYLDIIRLYTNAKDLEVASISLAEFEQKFTDFKDFPDASLKLADAYIAAGKFDKEREIYQNLLDFLGKNGKVKFPFESVENKDSTKELTQIKPIIASYPPSSNAGIEIASQKKPDDYYYNQTNSYKNYLSRETSDISYSEVLDRLIASLARENKTTDILTLYSAETAKYPAEQRLYEQMLQWLGQTNLADKQLEVYQNALKNFPERTWQDRFARWLIRNKRQDDFEKFSQSLVESFDDAETQDYLKQFVDGKEVQSAESFDGNLFFALYSLAHQRFPHNIVFVKGLLRYYQQNKLDTEWLNLLAEYYFESPDLRKEFLTYLAKKDEIRSYLKKSENLSVNADEIKSLPYKLFRADASVWLSDFEKSVVFYRELNQLYPNNPEFSESFISIARSFGQQNRNLLQESATFAQNQAENFPAQTSFRTRTGEIQAELGNYENARRNWGKIIPMAEGEKENYLETATIFWDYFQFDDALNSIEKLRTKFKDENIFAFQTGAIYEAKHETDAAINEYLKVFEKTENPDNEKYRTKERLKQLFQKPKLAEKITSAFENKRKTAKNEFRLVFNFADLLFQLKQQPQAVNLLKQKVSRETSRENLLESKQFFRDLEETEAFRLTLKRLIQTAKNPRDAISFRLQLAENLSENGKTEKAAEVLADLVKKFPKNYGVLTEAENFYWEIGKRENSLQILRTAQKSARGEFAYQFSRKFAQRLSSLNRTNQAEQILFQLHVENPNDLEVFDELANVYVFTNKPESLRKTFGETIEAVRKQDLEPREFTWQTEDLRKKMIKAFTRLKDYAAAAEQYIEIINREPENEENVEEAISYVKRYGGAETLLAYYQKTANEAFKNYRWNVVLARIYEANNDLPDAAENYRVAIYNQPEMIELYESLNEIYVKMQDYESALKTLEKLLELSNGEKKFIKQKIRILEILGRNPEAETEKQKLPVEEIPKPKTLREQFSEASSLRNSETEKAVEKYREAFENLAQNPFQSELKSADIAGYVQTVHKMDSLVEISEKLWGVRGKLIVEIETQDSVKSGKAREILKVLDGAVPEAIGNEIKNTATGNEILAFREDIKNRLQSNSDERNQTLVLLQNL
ncbi:MAG: tetratricopeptide repeat protein, partial [Actinomycetota bacterium]